MNKIIEDLSLELKEIINLKAEKICSNIELDLENKVVGITKKLYDLKNDIDKKEKLLGEKIEILNAAINKFKDTISTIESIEKYTINNNKFIKKFCK